MNQTFNKPLMPPNDALELLLAQLPSILEQEEVPLLQARGRILAEECRSTMDVPPHTNSAMDGYAVRSADLSNENTTLRITQRIAAGEIGQQLEAGEAARIFTGAPVPASADAVVMQENCRANGEQLSILQSVAVGENLRHAGDDIKAGASVLVKGHRLMPQDLGLLASIGKQSVAVVRKLRVTLLTTGDELVKPGVELKPGQIYNSNYSTLSSLLENLGVEVLDGGIVSDDFDGTRKALLTAAEHSDCIISTGGVSVGEEDHVKAAVEKEGALQLWKLAIKPGKPLACGRVANSQFFGLPGNPVSAFVTFTVIVRPCLLAMLGCKQTHPRKYKLPAGFTLQASAERQEYLRCRLEENKGQIFIQPHSNQSSGAAASLSEAEGLAVVPPYTSVAFGDNLDFIPFSEILN